MCIAVTAGRLLIVILSVAKDLMAYQTAMRSFATLRMT